MKRVFYAALLLSILASGGLFGFGRFEARAIYPFDATRQTPADAGVPDLREHVIETDGQSLIIWVAKPKPGQPTILYFHGNAGNLANRASRFQRFLNRGYGLIAPAYRGSSGSTGAPTEKALTQDARHIYSQLDQILPGTTPDKTVIYGESLGTGVALKLLSSADVAQPAAVVLEAPYTSIPDVVRHTYPRLKPLIPLMKNRWNSLENVSSLKTPLLILHGTDDPLIPIMQGQQIYTASPSSEKRFIAVEGADHSNIWRTDTLSALWDFIDGQ